MLEVSRTHRSTPPEVAEKQEMATKGSPVPLHKHSLGGFTIDTDIPHWLVRVAYRFATRYLVLVSVTDLVERAQLLVVTHRNNLPAGESVIASEPLLFYETMSAATHHRRRSTRPVGGRSSQLHDGV